MNDASNCTENEGYQSITVWYEPGPLDISKYKKSNTENCKIDHVNWIGKFSSITDLYMRIIYASLKIGNSKQETKDCH